MTEFPLPELTIGLLKALSALLIFLWLLIIMWHLMKR